MRNEYPRPQFERASWLSLNGTWQFAFDPKCIGQTEHWESTDEPFDMNIEVPFCPESQLSGIADQGMHRNVWYRRAFEVPEGWNERVVLHFGAVDYIARIYVNGHFVGTHQGGHVSFSFDITDYLTQDWRSQSTQVVTVLAIDYPDDETIARGKQFWKEHSESIWYTRTTGIWQSVWLEPVSEIHMTSVKLTPDIDQGTIAMHLSLNDRARCSDTPLRYEAKITLDGTLIAQEQALITSVKFIQKSFYVFGDSSFMGLPHGAKRCWTPENPRLFDIELTLYQGDTAVDTVKSYFGMRKVHLENGQFYLNNEPYYLRLVLDQGYWPEGLMTAPTDEAFVKDIEMTKEMGFNGCRKHQKVEDPRFLYWADKLGFVVWGEMAAASVYTDEAAIALQEEWAEVIQRDYNHPSIVAWVPFNESWGIPNIVNNVSQQAHTRALYHMIKAYDTMRPVVGNDGWVMTETDICAIHSYAHGNPDLEQDEDKVAFFKEAMLDPTLLLSSYHCNRKIFADGYAYEGQPIMMTEVGGIAYQNDATKSWGYTQASNEESYLRQLRHVFESIYASPYISGVCYTQITDVEQETNGLLTYDRQYKVSPELVREIVHAWRPNFSIPARSGCRCN